MSINQSVTLLALTYSPQCICYLLSFLFFTVYKVLNLGSPLKHELKEKLISLNIPVINLIIKINLVFIPHLEIKYFDLDIDMFYKIKFIFEFYSKIEIILILPELLSWNSELILYNSCDSRIHHF